MQVNFALEKMSISVLLRVFWMLCNSCVTINYDCFTVGHEYSPWFSLLHDPGCYTSTKGLPQLLIIPISEPNLW